MSLQPLGCVLASACDATLLRYLNRIIQLLALVAAPIVFGSAQTSAAHEMHIFIERIDGADVQGRVYFQGGVAARDTIVRVVDPQGHPLGETRTNAEGRFAFRASVRCDHLFSAELSDGHAVRRPATVRRAQLPADLPELSTTATDRNNSAVNNTPQRAKDEEPSAPAAPTQPLGPPTHNGKEHGRTTADDNVSAAISAQLDDIRERLERMETAVRIRDLLGGVGYIIGAAGIAYYVLARRSNSTGIANSPREDDR